jgi:hypothetical protein
MNAITILEPVQAGALSLPEVEIARGFAMDAKAPSTRRAYQDGFRDFTSWCRARGLQAMPASVETTATYLAWCATSGLSVSTIASAARHCAMPTSWRATNRRPHPRRSRPSSVAFAGGWAVRPCTGRNLRRRIG